MSDIVITGPLISVSTTVKEYKEVLETWQAHPLHTNVVGNIQTKTVTADFIWDSGAVS